MSDGDTVYRDTSPPDNAAGGSDGIPQLSARVLGRWRNRLDHLAEFSGCYMGKLKGKLSLQGG